jgi:hypothetical protein
MIGPSVEALSRPYETRWRLEPDTGFAEKGGLT